MIFVYLAMFLLATFGLTLLASGYYLYREKSIESGMHEILYAKPVSNYPANKYGKKLLVGGQICIATDLALALVLFLSRS